MNALGRCCRCETRTGVRNILMLPFEAPPEAKSGWGCVVCGMPSRGAIAVMCDDCMGKEPKFVCGGAYAVDDVRIPLAEYEQRPFGHDLSKHPEIQRQ